MTPTHTSRLPSQSDASPSRPLAMVAAISRNRVIGAQGGIPWHYPEDMRHFRRLTIGHAVLMGRVTLESLKQPLRDRHNLVLSRSRTAIPGCEVFPSWEQLVQRAWELDPCPFVIGGAQIYQIALPQATHIYLTQIDSDIKGDTYFPILPPDEWQLETQVQSGPLCFQTWNRVPSQAIEHRT